MFQSEPLPNTEKVSTLHLARGVFGGRPCHAAARNLSVRRCSQNFTIPPQHLYPVRIIVQAHNDHRPYRSAGFLKAAVSKSANYIVLKSDQQSQTVCIVALLHKLLHVVA